MQGRKSMQGEILTVCAQKRRVLVIGGGASGLMAAITAARGGAKVTLLEKKTQVGRKLLVTGNGRCNLTNTNQALSNYRCSIPEFAAEALGVFGSRETVAFFQELGIFVRDKNGYLYPYSQQASAVADALRMEAEHQRVKLSCNTKILGIQRKGGLFLVETPGWSYEGDALILACGSMASSQGSGDGYAYAKSFGHRICPVLPALVQLRAGKNWPNQLSGIRVEARVRLYIQGELVSEDTGEVQMTAYGLSGIPVFQVSRYASRALEKGLGAEAELHFLPGFSKEELAGFLRNRIDKNGYKSMEAYLTGLFPEKLIPVLIQRAGIKKGSLAGKVTEQEWKQLICQITGFRVPVAGTNGFEQAQVCTGGVDISEVNPLTMESRLVRNLYFAGELLDVDGACGGYNLQWAWTSGYLAGRRASGAEDVPLASKGK